MSLKAFIASKPNISSRLILTSCSTFEIDVVSMEDQDAVLAEMRDARPNIIFLDESIDIRHSIVNDIRGIPGLEEAPVVYTSTDVASAAFSGRIGSDLFLPIPFSKMKFFSVVRAFLGYPNQILIVNDAADDVKNLSRTLASMGYSIMFAGSGDRCMTVVHETFPDLILANDTLKDMSGLELSKKLKNTDLASHIPLMILSESDSVDMIEKYFDAGAYDVLLMPFDHDDNIKKISQVVSPPKRGRTEKAMVIDDSPMIRNLISRMFKNLGFKVTTAENGREALDSALLAPPDIITCDYDMPTMNGWEFCMEAKKIERLRDIPIIMVTARGNEVDRKKGKVLGVTEYLIKPFREEELQKVATKALSDIKKKKERDELSKYIAPDALWSVSDVLDGVRDREPEEKFITILFSDICSFTPKCERLSPRAVVRLLNSYFDHMIRVLQSNNAIVDKFIGDAIVARFDSGDSSKDALDAVTAACEMIKVLEDFNRNSLETIEIRIGINSGTVILGNIGCDLYRLDYTMIGDNVNITQRLENQAPALGCLISASTYDLVRDFAEVGPVVELSLKGKSVPVQAFPLINMKAR